MRAKVKPVATEQPTLIVDNGKSAVPAVQNEAQPVALTTGPDALFAIIERASRDNSVDLDRMQKLIDMHTALKAGNARTEFDQAMSLAQQEMMAIRASSKSDKGKYANYATLDKAIRPIYTKHGFSVSFDTDPGAPELTVRLVATVAHGGGHRERRQLDIPADGKGAKGGDVMTRTHATASAVTYGKRYLSSMIWNLAVDHDDDGNAASDRFKAWTDTSIQELNALEKDRAAFDKWSADNEKSVSRLKKNAPEEFARFQIAFQNAAERAGIKNEEPKRGDTKEKKAASAGDPPHSDQPGDGQPEAKADTKAAPSGPPEPETVGEILDRKPPVTDVEDLNAPIEFGTFETAKAFLDFSSKWMNEPERTAAQAQKWHDQFKDKINEYLQHKFPKTDKSWIKESMADTFSQYVKLTANEPPA